MVGAFLGLLLAAALLLMGWGVPPRAQLVIGIGTDPGTLDPHRATGTPEAIVLRSLLEGLTVLDPRSAEPLPGQAQSWQVSTDGLRWTFQLRPDLLWSDGKALTAGDFRRSWLDLLDPINGCPYGDLLEQVKGASEWRAGEGQRQQVGITAIDPRTLRVDLRIPLPWLPFLASQMPLLPVHSSGPPTRPESAVVNGPYRLESRRLRDRVRVVANRHYHSADEVAVESIDFLAIESANTLLNLFAAGAADWVRRVPPAVVPTLVTDPHWSPLFHASPYLEIAFYRLNVTRPPLDDVRVRRALSLAVDRQEIVERVTRGGEQPAWSFVPWPATAIEEFRRTRIAAGAGDPGSAVPLPRYRRPAIGVDGIVDADAVSPAEWGTLGHHPERARALLAEAGFQVPGSVGGEPIPPFEILYNSSASNTLVAELLQAQWRRELGVEVRLRNIEWKSYLDGQRALDYDISRSSWVADYPDPMTFLAIFLSSSPNNRTGWSDGEYDDLLEASMAASDEEVRLETMRRAETILLERGPVIPLWYAVTGGLVSDRVTGFFGNPLDQHFSRFLGIEEGKR